MVRLIFVLMLMLAVMPLPARAQMRSSQVDGLPIQCTAAAPGDDLSVLVSLNDYLAWDASKPPYTGYALRIRPDCQIDVLDRQISHGAKIGLWDLRRIGDRYVYAIAEYRLGYWHSGIWFRDLAGHVTPPMLPLRDEPYYDAHESLVPAQDAFFSLLYVSRLTALGQYVIHPEIVGRLWDGHKVWHWSGETALPADWSLGTVGDKRFLDIFHANQLQVLKDTAVLGLRDANAVALISLADGKLVDAIRQPEWRFVNDPANGFSRAHTVQITPRGTLLAFDDGWKRQPRYPSRAVEYALDFKARTATMIWEYKAAEDYPNRDTMGSVYDLPDGRRLIGWGAVEQKGSCKPGQMVQMFTIVRGDRMEREVRMPCGWSIYRAHADLPEEAPAYGLSGFMQAQASAPPPPATDKAVPR